MHTDHAHTQYINLRKFHNVVVAGFAAAAAAATGGSGSGGGGGVCMYVCVSVRWCVVLW